MRLSLEGEIVRNPSVSLSPTLNKNKKVKQYIKKMTHKPIALRFWVKGGVIPLCIYVWPISPSCEISPVIPLGFSQQPQHMSKRKCSNFLGR